MKLHNFEFSGWYKMLQLYVREDPVIIVPLEEKSDEYFNGPYHHELLWDYIEKVGLTLELEIMFEGTEKEYKRPVMDLEGQYRVVGGGRISLNLESKIMHFSERSQGYDVGPNNEHFDDWKERNPGWHIIDENEESFIL